MIYEQFTQDLLYSKRKYREKTTIKQANFVVCSLRFTRFIILKSKLKTTLTFLTNLSLGEYDKYIH